VEFDNPDYTWLEPANNPDPWVHDPNNPEPAIVGQEARMRDHAPCPRIAGVVAREIRAEMGYPKHTESNRLVASRLITQRLEAMHVRRADYHRAHVYALMLTFVRSLDEIEAMDVMSSQDVALRECEFNAVRIDPSQAARRYDFGLGSYIKPNHPESAK
jgi:hypothetical protein